MAILTHSDTSILIKKEPIHGGAIWIIFAPVAISQEDIQYCWDAADEAYKVIAERHPDANFIK